MRIALVSENINLPVKNYGGTERLVWWLGKELARLGHQVIFLAGKDTDSRFARVIPFDPDKPILQQIPPDIDLIHAFNRVHAPEGFSTPYVCTIGGVGRPGEPYDLNTVFVSKKHARNHNSQSFVYNGVDFGDYGAPLMDNARTHLLFLAKASVRSKNLRGCIQIARRLNQRLSIVGGWGVSLDRRIRYRGMLGGEKKNREIQNATALLFPVIWEEPFGLAIVEALYFGLPVYGTPYGSLPELVIPEVGFLADNSRDLIAAISDGVGFNRRRCHEYARDSFNIRIMAQEYLKVYERVMSGRTLNAQPPVRAEFPRRYVWK